MASREGRAQAMNDFKTGDLVRIESYSDGLTVDGVVMLASSNGKSLMLAFDGFIDGGIGMLPVLRDDDGRYHSIMTGNLVFITKRDA